jgi:hypothetical protein
MSNTLTLGGDSAVLGEQETVILPLSAGSLGDYGPLGFDAGDANLYRYVGNDPVNATDPTGLYTLKWHGTWTPAQKTRVLNGFSQVSARVGALLAMIDAEKNSLSACELQTLGPDLDKLRAILSKIDKNMGNNNYVIDVYHEKMGYRWSPNTNTNTYMSMDGDDNNLYFNPDLTFNDRLDSSGVNWMTMPVSDFNGKLLHELSHLHGSEDNTQKGNTAVFPPWYMHAQSIEQIMNGPLSSILEYNIKKGQARANCASGSGN